MPAFSDGSEIRASSYIGDVASIMVEAVFCPDCYNGVFNLGSDQPYSVKAWAEIVAAAFGVAPDIRYLPARLEVHHAHANHGQVRPKLGFEAKTFLEEGICRMVAWASAKAPSSARSRSRLVCHCQDRPIYSVGTCERLPFGA